MFRDIGDELGEAEALSGLGEVYQSMGEPANALSFHQVRLFFVYSNSCECVKGMKSLTL